MALMTMVVAITIPANEIMCSSNMTQNPDIDEKYIEMLYLCPQKAHHCNNFAAVTLNYKLYGTESNK